MLSNYNSVLNRILRNSISVYTGRFNNANTVSLKSGISELENVGRGIAIETMLGTFMSRAK